MLQLKKLRALTTGGVPGVALLKVGGLVFAVVTTIALARLLSPIEFGRYSYALSLATLLTLPVLQGLPVLVVREVARSVDGARDGASRHMLEFSDRLVVAFGTMGAFALCIWYSVNPAFDIGLALAAGFLPLVLVSVLVRGSVVRAFGRPFLGHLPDMVLRPAVLLVLLVLLFVSSQRNATTAMGLHVAAALSALFLAGRLLPGGAGDGSYSPPAFGAAARSLLPLSMVGGMQLINSQVDVVLIGLLASKEEVGVYRIATMLALQVSFMLTVVNAVFAPRFAALYRAGNIESLRRINRRGAIVAFSFGLVVVLAYAVGGRWLIIATVGEAYVDAFEPLMILSLAHLLTLWAGTTNVLLTMIGRERDVLFSAGIAVSTNIVLCVLLVPGFGLIGAASGSAMSLVVWRVVLSRFLHVRLASAQRG